MTHTVLVILIKCHHRPHLHVNQLSDSIRHRCSIPCKSIEDKSTARRLEWRSLSVTICHQPQCLPLTSTIGCQHLDLLRMSYFRMFPICILTRWSWTWMSCLQSFLQKWSLKVFEKTIKFTFKTPTTVCHIEQKLSYLRPFTFTDRPVW